MTELKIDSDLMKDLVHKAILDSLTTESREHLISAALQHLITPPPKSAYSAAPEKTPLQVAFEQATRESAVKVTREVIEAEYRPQIEAMIRTTVIEALSDEDRFKRAISYAVGEAVERFIRDPQDFD